MNLLICEGEIPRTHFHCRQTPPPSHGGVFFGRVLSLVNYRLRTTNVSVVIQPLLIRRNNIIRPHFEIECLGVDLQNFCCPSFMAVDFLKNFNDMPAFELLEGN